MKKQIEWVILILQLLVLGAIIVGGVYVAIWLCLAGGIMQFIEGVKADPTSGKDIAWGIVRFLLTGPSVFISIIAFSLTAAAFFRKRNY